MKSISEYISEAKSIREIKGLFNMANTPVIDLWRSFNKLEDVLKKLKSSGEKELYNIWKKKLKALENSIQVIDDELG